MRLAFAALFVVAAVVPVSGQQKPKNSDDVLRQRILLQERFNKGWDIQTESRQDLVARCNAEAKTHYSAIRYKKRRMFVKECINRIDR